MEHLVTVFGGAGYIGAPLVRLLLQNGYSVRLFDNFLFGYDGIQELPRSNLEIIEGDICDIKAVSQATNGADTVVLLAAIVGHRVEEIMRADMREVNFLASSVVLDSAIEHGAGRFLFASTDSVYGTQRGIMYETGMPDPVSAYSRLKLRMEERVINSKRRDFHPTALRVATCYGYSPRMRFDLVANSLIRDAVCKKHLSISNGEQVRALIHVDDVARAFLQCIKAHVSLVSGEVYNVGVQDQVYQVNQLANIVKGLVPDCVIESTEGEADLLDYKLSCTKIAKVLDFNSQCSVEPTLAQLRDMLLEGRFGDPYSPKYHNT